LDFEGLEVTTQERAEAMGIPLDMVFVQSADCLPYLTDPKSAETIHEWLKVTEARLLVVDSWRRATPGLEENDSGATVEAAAGLCILARDFALPVLVTAHSRKVRQEGRWEMSLDDLRGSSALTDVARSALVIEKPDAGRDTRRVRVEKSNFAAKPEPLGFDLDGETVIWTTPPRRGRDMPVRVAAAEAVKIALAQMPLPYTELAVATTGLGIAQTTMRRVLNDVAVKGTDGRWALRTNSVP
jgi:hypothetical protein